MSYTPDPAAIILRQRKRDARQIAEQHRQRLKLETPEAPSAVAKHLLNVIAENFGANSNKIISSYATKGSELAMEPVNEILVQARHSLALPVVLGRAHPLAFRRYNIGDPLAHGILDVSEPLPEAEIVMPDILLVPMLGFDRMGNRLGYGGGYYDRTIALLRRESAILAIGIAFAGQELEQVPVGETDAPLDWMITEQEAIKLG